MTVLGIETATPICSVGLVGKQGFIAEHCVQKENIHAEYLPQAVDAVLSGSRLNVQDLDGIAVSIGPGSFTGLRIGLCFAKGLAFGLDIPIVAVPTMDALIDQVPLLAEWTCIMLTARKVEIYFGLYRNVHENWILQGECNVVHEDRIGSVLPDETILFAGEGSARFSQKIKKQVKKAQFLPIWQIRANGFSVARKGRELLLAGQSSNPDELVPLYIKRFQGVA